MPELSIVTTRTCPSNLHWELTFTSESSGVTYTMTYDKGRYSCTCLGFEHRGWCKHIRNKELADKRCGGLWGAFAGCVYDDEKCPDCGEPTEPIQVGT